MLPRRGGIRRLLTSIALGVTLLGCSSPAQPVLGRIFGTVTIDEVGAAGVVVTLTRDGQQRGQLLTGSDGTYNFVGTLEPGAYRVTISSFPSDVTFDRTVETIAIQENGEFEVNFAGSTG